MFTAKKFREKAAKSAESLKHTDVPSEIRKLERSKAKLLCVGGKRGLAGDQFRQDHPRASNTACTMTAPERLWRTWTDADVEERILRCLGAAVIMQWNTIPTKLQRELFDTAGSVGDVLKSSELRATNCTLSAQAKG